MPDLVAPIIPDAQKNRAPDLFLEGAGRGLAAFAQYANIRRERESAALELAAKERMNEENHQFEREKLATETDRMSAVNAAHAAAYYADAEVSKERANAYREGRATAAQRDIQFNKQMQGLVDDFNTRADKRQLNDPQFAVHDPIGFAWNLLGQKEEFQNGSHIGTIKAPLDQWQKIADQQTIRMRPVIKDETGTAMVAGEGRDVPIWKVALKIKNPETRDEAMEELRLNGHITDKITPGYKSPWWKVWEASIPETKETNIPDAKAKAILEGSKRELERTSSRVPPAMLPKSFSYGTEPTAFPETQAPPSTIQKEDSGYYPPQSSNSRYDQPTETEARIARARAAIQHGGADIALVAQRLRDGGIDPSALFAT